MNLRWLLPLLALTALGLFVVFNVIDRDVEPEVESVSTETQVTTPEVTEPEVAEPVATEPEVTEPEPETSQVAEVNPAATEVIGYVNGRPLYRLNLQGEVTQVLNQYRQIYAQFGQNIDTLLTGASGIELSLNMELQGFERLVGREVIAEQAELNGVVVTEEEAEAEFRGLFADYLESQGMTEEEFTTNFVSAGGDLDFFLSESRRGVRDQMVAERVSETVIGGIELTRDDIEEYFEANRASYETEEQIRASHILLETQTEAEVVVSELDAGADFAELAREKSTGPSASSGGDLGEFPRGAMVGAFEEAAFALEVDEYSGVVETEFGFHVILKTGHTEAVKPTLDEIYDEVREDAESNAKNEAFREWFEANYEAADVEIVLPILAAVRLKTEDLDAALEAFEALLGDPDVSEPFLAYLIATSYEERQQRDLAEKATLEQESPDNPESVARIGALTVAIEEARLRAIELYQQLLDDVGEDTTIQARLNGLLDQGEPESEETNP